MATTFPPELFTERLRLRRVTPEDANEVLAYASDSEVTQTIVERARRKISITR